MVLVKPERFENASEIADHLREKRTVVLNLESTNKEIARRLLDFLSGVAYANEGKIKKVAISTYIITPYNVDILGDLIDELENNKRGVYGGAIGYLDFTGNLDTCIAIRIAYQKNGRVFVRSGAGIVADSVPEQEFEECMNKARASLRALELAQEAEL